MNDSEALLNMGALVVGGALLFTLAGPLLLGIVATVTGVVILGLVVG